MLIGRHQSWQVSVRDVADTAHVLLHNTHVSPPPQRSILKVKMVRIFQKSLSVHCSLMSSAPQLLPTSFTISLLSNVLPFTMWFNASQCT